MKLQQLRYIWEVAHHDLNVSATAQSLFTSQPGISKQIRLLEDELGVEIFARSGKHLTHVTPVGQDIIAMAGKMLREAGAIKQVAQEYSNEKQGSLSIATTHTQARYALPEIIGDFRKAYPEVTLHMNQGSPEQIAELAAAGQTDFAIATEGLNLFNELIMMPCYRWNRAVVVPKEHPLCAESKLTLAAVARYPIVTYVFGFTGRSKLDDAFARQGLAPNVVFTATDTDVIKTYVRLGIGVGIIAQMAYDWTQDSDLVALDASHLFESSITHIGFRKGTFLRRYMLDFMAAFAPHLDADTINAAIACANRGERDKLFDSFDLPNK
ncbi:MAG: HTH-type transcriptional regulator CysB [Gammaproteobacteria bacterium]|jgi:LysR family transcriptional regulator, cys regulon transcriptional activator|nr:HTH-type transcriptional regulator CysB [Gammaproteobacteria bacterium]